MLVLTPSLKTTNKVNTRSLLRDANKKILVLTPDLKTTNKAKTKSLLRDAKRQAKKMWKI